MIHKLKSRQASKSKRVRQVTTSRRATRPGTTSQSKCRISGRWLARRRASSVLSYQKHVAPRTGFNFHRLWDLRRRQETVSAGKTSWKMTVLFLPRGRAWPLSKKTTMTARETATFESLAQASLKLVAESCSTTWMWRIKTCRAFALHRSRRRPSIALLRSRRGARRVNCRRVASSHRWALLWRARRKLSSQSSRCASLTSNWKRRRLIEPSSAPIVPHRWSLSSLSEQAVPWHPRTRTWTHSASLIFYRTCLGSRVTWTEMGACKR